jgi:hypothetical protein
VALAHLEGVGRRAVSSGDPALFALHEELAAYPGGGTAPLPDLEVAAIATPLRIRAGEEARELRFISTLTRFRTAVDVTVSELSIESFFPVDAETAEYVRAALGQTA